MPALFQYAIFFLAAVLFVSLVLCVRESTDPNDNKDKARTRSPEPAAPSLQRIEARTIPGGVTKAEPNLTRTASHMRREPSAPASVREPSVAPLALASGPVAPAFEPVSASLLTRAPVPDRASGASAHVLPAARTSGPEGSAGVVSPLTRVPEAVGALGEPASSGTTSTTSGAAPVPEAPTPAPRLRTPEAGTEPHPPVRTLGDGLPVLPTHDQALDRRNDTLWDLVVHLRDYVEQLRAERHALREETQQLRTALAEATEEVRVLRAGQGAANSNEVTAVPAEQPAAEAARLGIPKRLH